MENLIAKTITTEDCAPFIGRKIPVTTHKPSLKIGEIASRWACSKQEVKDILENWNVPINKQGTAGASVASYVILALEEKRKSISQ